MRPRPQNFYREIEKEELYIRYIYKLSELHKRDQSYTEAGFTLLLRAKGLEVSRGEKSGGGLEVSRGEKSGGGEHSLTLTHTSCMAVVH